MEIWQVLLFTATLPPEVKATADAWQKDPVSLHVAVSGALISRTVTQVEPPSHALPPSAQRGAMQGHASAPAPHVGSLPPDPDSNPRCRRHRWSRCARSTRSCASC